MFDLQWLAALAAAIISGIAGVLFTKHIKSNNELRERVQTNTKELELLKQKQESNYRLLKQKMTSVENELRDMKEYVKDDTNEIKVGLKELTSALVDLASSHSELKGHISDYRN